MSKSITLVNKHTGNLDLKYFEFKENCHFNHIQRLGYYSMIWIKKGSGLAKIGFTEYEFSKDTMFSFTPYQPFMFDVDDNIEGLVIHFHPDFFVFTTIKNKLHVMEFCLTIYINHLFFM